MPVQLSPATAQFPLLFESSTTENNGDGHKALLAVLQRIAEYLASLPTIATDISHLVEALAPIPTEKVGTPYVAEKLGVTLQYAAQMAREGRIPKSCAVPGTGGGKQWKFFREKIDQWLESR